MKVSVVIPTHNRDYILRRAVDSVLNQTYSNLEIIIISDGSTDNTEEVLKELEEEDSRIKSISYHPSKGANYARNKGIELSSGSHIAFLDDDDEWHEDKLEMQIDIFKSNNKIGLVYTGKKVIYVNEKKEYSSISKLQGDLSKEILKKNVIGTTSSVMVRKKELKKAGFFDEKMPAMQDYELWIRICQITQVGVVPMEKVNYYNDTNKKQISSSTDKYVKALEKIMEKHASLYNKLSVTEYKEMRMRGNLNLAKKALRNNQKKTSFKYVQKALSIKPTLIGIGHLILILIPYKIQLLLRDLIKN